MRRLVWPACGVWGRCEQWDVVVSIAPCGVRPVDNGGCLNWDWWDLVGDSWDFVVVVGVVAMNVNDSERLAGNGVRLGSRSAG